MSKMFTIDGKRMVTYNVFTGCRFDCYNGGCWARKLVEGKLKDTPKYRECGFTPTFHPSELNKKFKPGEFVFVSSMGDISFCDSSALELILQVSRKYPETKFLFQTKSPSVFERVGSWPENTVHGITLETNRNYNFSKAAHPTLRHEVFLKDPHPNKLISIEPVMNLDLEIFTSWVLDIVPEIVFIGADNYNCHLPEPSWDKVEALIGALESNGIQVVRKEGLRRLKV